MDSKQERSLFLLRPCCSCVSPVRSLGGILSICATPQQTQLNVFLFFVIFRLRCLLATAVLCVNKITPPAPMTLPQDADEEPQNESLAACASPQKASAHLPPRYQRQCKHSCRWVQLHPRHPSGAVWGFSKRLRALSGSLLKERQRIQWKEKEWGSWQRGLRWPGGKSSLMPVRVWASSELMKPTGGTANFSWNHLSGLANLSRLLRPEPVFLALLSLPDISTERDGTRRWQWEQKGILCPADLRSRGWFQPVPYMRRLFDP